MSIVTVTVFYYKPRARFRAFANMGRVRMQPLRGRGLQFGKLLGSGIDFGLIPDFSTYVFLGVWDDASAHAFPQTDIYKHLSQGTQQVGTLYLQTQRAHGLWNGQNPFYESVSQSVVKLVSQSTELRATNDKSRQVAVLTRATIRPRALPDFWRHVPQARQRLTDQGDDLLFGIGVGEVPLMQQCTISVWRNAADVDRYAYRQSGHREVVKLTRERKWYSEELFARFTVLRAEGEMFGYVRGLIS